MFVLESLYQRCQGGHIEDCVEKVEVNQWVGRQSICCNTSSGLKGLLSLPHTVNIYAPLAKETLSGIKAAQCLTFHSDGIPRIQNIPMITAIVLVNNGSRKT